jgi:hypothetical protein
MKTVITVDGLTSVNDTRPILCRLGFHPWTSQQSLNLGEYGHVDVECPIGGLTWRTMASWWWKLARLVRVG